LEGEKTQKEPDLIAKIMKKSGLLNRDAKDSRKTAPSKMAEGIALHRCAETLLPEDIRIFSDPYAVHFLDPATLAWARDHPAEAQAFADELERKTPGWSNAIRGRIRFFDDIVQDAAGEGFSQLVILGAGYDTRAYRIDTLKDHVRIFEIDRPETLERKAGILKKIFGGGPDHVTFIPLDMADADCWQDLVRAGWSSEGKTLFLLEGLVMYLPQQAVEHLLAGIAGHTGAGSAVLFDFMPRSLADGTSDAEGGQIICEWTAKAGEPILSGFSDDEIVPLLEGLGFSGIRIIPSCAFAEMYYTGKRADRKVSGLMSIAHARIP
jgi:methyltransferase (TIGR00027 family)